MEKIDLIEPFTLTNREKEIYRTLRTNLEFTGVENRVIAITSCIPGDGKSTVSFRLASALAEGGKRTVLIDADMRKSVFTQRYQTKGELPGLSHVLSGQASVNEVVFATNKEWLYVLPTGKFPINPTELLANGRLEQVLPTLKNMFDYVIIDTPPLGSVVDAAIVAKYSDATMLVVSAEGARRAEVKKVLEQFKTANPNFLGVVLNKVNFKNGAYGRYGSYYGKEYSSYYE